MTIVTLEAIAGHLKDGCSYIGKGDTALRTIEGLNIVNP